MTRGHGEGSTYQDTEGRWRASVDYGHVSARKKRDAALRLGSLLAARRAKIEAMPASSGE